MDKQLYSTLEAAEQLGVTRARIRQLIDEGLHESIKVGKLHLVTREGIKQARGRKKKPGPITNSKKGKSKQ